MRSHLNSDEIVTKHGRANSQWGSENVGGHLYLTNKRLIFESHLFNVRTGTLTTDLSGVLNITKCWRKFLGRVPIFPNSIDVEMKDGAHVQFVVYNRNKWITAIMDAVQQLTAT